MCIVYAYAHNTHATYKHDLRDALKIKVLNVEILRKIQFHET